MNKKDKELLQKAAIGAVGGAVGGVAAGVVMFHAEKAVLNILPNTSDGVGAIAYNYAPATFVTGVGVAMALVSKKPFVQGAGVGMIAEGVSRVALTAWHSLRTKSQIKSLAQDDSIIDVLQLSDAAKDFNEPAGEIEENPSENVNELMAFSIAESEND